MSTDLAALLGKRKIKDTDDDDDNDNGRKKRTTKVKKTKEEREEEQLELEQRFQENYHCDYVAYTIISLEQRPSRIDPSRIVTVISWENDLAPPPQVLATLSQPTQRLAMESKGGAQGQEGWHEHRSKRSVTASMIARGFCMSDPHLSSMHRVVQSMQSLLENANLVPKFQGNALTQYGQDNEPFCCKVYMQERCKQSLIRVGFIPHPTNPFCGATPDGVSLDGQKIIELKCPKQRYFQEGDACPINYWHQCQLSMEICASAVESDTAFGICDYFEMRHMKRPRGLRTNCVCIRRDKAWFSSIQRLLAQYDAHLKRLRNLAKLFPQDMFEKNKEIQQTVNTIPKMFSKVILQE